MNANPTRRRVARAFLNALILIGVLVAFSPALQNAYAWWSQRQLLARWDATTQDDARHPGARTRDSKPHGPEPHGPKPRIKAARPLGARSGARQAPGQGSNKAGVALAQTASVTMRAQDNVPADVPLPATRLSIPEIGVDAIVVQGTDDEALARGPGHDPKSALPGQEGNCVLAAHRNVYGSWFYNLDQLWAGSVAEVRSGGQTYRYTMVGVRTVSEADSSVLRATPGTPPSLTLITCTLPHSPFRLVATGYLQSQ